MVCFAAYCFKRGSSSDLIQWTETVPEQFSSDKKQAKQCSPCRYQLCTDTHIWKGRERERARERKREKERERAVAVLIAA